MDIKEKRKLDLFHFVVDFSFGSLWHIKESFWARTIPGFRPKRKWHPGLSIYNGSADTLIPHIPMLLGTSRSALAHYGFAVKGITESHGEDYKTWFGTKNQLPAAHRMIFSVQNPKFHAIRISRF